MTTETLADGLNAAQTEAFRHTTGAALVLAGAGSGKTTVLIRRIARLIADNVPASRIFVATFTRRAAEEMRLRLIELVGEAAIEGLWMGTFHAHCLRILKKEFAERDGKEGKFDLADEYWVKRVARAINSKPSDLFTKLPNPPFGLGLRLDPKMALLAIGAAKNSGWDVAGAETILHKLYPDWDEPQILGVTKFWAAYEMAKEKRFDLLSKVPMRRLDFDDLLVEAYLLLRDNKELLTAYQSLWDYLLIDETQDTSELQWEFARLLAHQHGNLFVVGDVGQSVYGFRGCDPRLTVMGFQKAYPDGQIIRLAQNYRSPGVLVTIANELIVHSDLDERYRLLMRTEREEGLLPELHQYFDADAEAAAVVERIREIRNGKGGQFKDFAVLYRANAYSRAFEDALIAFGIPYLITGGTSFYNRREVKDLLAYLQLSVDPHCAAGDEAAKRVLNIASNKLGRTTRGLGNAFAEAVAERAAQQKISFYEALKRGAYKTAQDVAVLDFRNQIREIHDAGASAAVRLTKARQTGYDSHILNDEGDSADDGEGSSRLENLDELIASSSRFHAPEAMLTFIAGQVRKANESSRALDAVNLMTIHRSKGLEWTTVFVVGFAHNLLPHIRSARYSDGVLLPESVEEERRLAYVAITRARERLSLSWPRIHNGKALGASPFLQEMPTVAPLLIAALQQSAADETLWDTDSVSNDDGEFDEHDSYRIEDDFSADDELV